jgi:hypothetical protein
LVARTTDRHGGDRDRTQDAARRLCRWASHGVGIGGGSVERPLHPFALRGAIWYQGESNSGEGALYTEHTRALVAGWRSVWADPSLAYYYVQIAPYNYGGAPETIAEFWEAQAAAQEIPGTGMIVINDIGDLKDIHPVNKQDVGRRLSGWALARTYGKSDVAYASPTVESVEAQGGSLRLNFRDAEELTTRDGQPPSWFEVIDTEEGGFEPAQARIDGRSVVLTSPNVPRPVGVRFAWSMLAEPNLRNAAGLPVGAFRAGTIPKRDLLALKVRESREYQLVHDLDGETGSPSAVQRCPELHRTLAQNPPADSGGHFGPSGWVIRAEPRYPTAGSLLLNDSEKAGAVFDDWRSLFHLSR